MATPPSSYGERPALQGFRRSFTTPHRRLSHHERAGLENADSAAEVLFSHPSARVILFAPPTDSISTSTADIPPDTDYPVDTVETLPWASTTETTLASGLLKIEKVQGSTNFLKSKEVEKPILRNSQCWCVDNVSKFVLRVRKFVYYRIELPTTSAEDIAKVEEFKSVLKRILKYEVTPCPFRRGFHVDLPESALTPRRKGTWKRKEGSVPSSPLADESPVPRLKSSRTWNRRAVSDGRFLDSKLPNLRADSGYDESLINEQMLQRPDLSPMRSTTPSSIASSEQVAESEEHDRESEASLSDHEDTPADSSQPEDPSEFRDEIEPEVLNGDQQQPVADEASDVESAQPPDEQVIRNQEAPRENRVMQTDVAPLLNGSRPHTSPVEEIEAFVEPDERNLKPVEPTAEINAPESPSDVESPVDAAQSVDQSDPVPEAESEPLEQDHQTYEPSTESSMIKDDGLEIATSVAHEDTPEDDTLSTVESVPDDALSLVLSVDSFHTLASEDDPAPYLQAVHAFDKDPTPMAEYHDPFAFASRQHKRDLSEMTVTASSPRSTEDDHDSLWAEPMSSLPVIQEGLRHRLLRRSLSPLPPAATLFAPPPQNQQYQSQGNHLTSAILQKAMNLALVKPIEVVVLLVHILARIAGGATVNDLMSGDLFKKPEQGPDHRRNSSLPDQIDFRRDDATDEDDFGIPIRGRARSTDTEKHNDGTDSLIDLD